MYKRMLPLAMISGLVGAIATAFNTATKAVLFVIECAVSLAQTLVHEFLKPFKADPFSYQLASAAPVTIGRPQPTKRYADRGAAVSHVTRLRSIGTGQIRA